MIDFLIGIPEIYENGTVSINVHNVGYLLYCSSTTLSALPTEEREVKLYTHMNVTDSAISLYGFASTLERELFRALITVPKVGAKSAVSILSLGEPTQIVGFIVNRDIKALSRAGGIGKRTAEAIIVELHDRFAKLGIAKEADSDEYNSYADMNEDSDVVLALMALGYERGESLRAAALTQESGLSTQEHLARALLKIGVQ